MTEVTLGERIAYLRREKNLSQEGLGELVGVSRQAVSKWEADRALPDMNNCVAMSRVFGISLVELLELEENVSGGDSDGRDPTEGEEKIKNLTADQVLIVEKMIDKYTSAQKKIRRRLCWPLILLGCLLVVGAAWLWQWLTDMNRKINYLHGEVAGLRSEIITGVSEQLRVSLNGDELLPARYMTKVRQVDLEKNQITYVLEMEFLEPLLIYQNQFMIRQGKNTWTVDMESAGGLRYTGEITCPIGDDAAFYIIVEADDGTIRREKVAVWNPEERYTLFVDGWVRWASLEQSGLIAEAVEAATVYVSGFSYGYGQGELMIPLQISQAEVIGLCGQDIIAVQALDIGSLNVESTTKQWVFQQDVDIAVPDDAAEAGDILTFELRVRDNYGREYTRIISQYQVRQDGGVSPLLGGID